MTKLMYRHGDLLVESIDQIPVDATQRNSNIILGGTATGHVHQLNNGMILEKDSAVYIQVPEAATITHQEHNTIALPKGDYQVIFQHEYDPYEQAARQVLD